MRWQAQFRSYHVAMSRLQLLPCIVLACLIVQSSCSESFIWPTPTQLDASGPALALDPKNFVFNSDHISPRLER